MNLKIAKVSKRLKDGSVRYHYYAWRNGPKFWSSDSPVDYANPPDGFGEALDAARKSVREAARSERYDQKRDTNALIERYKQSGDYHALRPASKETTDVYLEQIREEFGADPVAIFEDPAILDDVTAWRDEKANKGQLRAADHRVRHLSRLLNFAISIGWLKTNHVEGMRRLYSNDRSDVIFEPGERDLIFKGDGAAIPPPEPHVAAIFTLAFFTGARRTDLASIPLTADRGDEFVWYTSKSGERVEAIVPILPPLRAFLDARKADKRIKATTILVNSRARPWTPRGLSDAVAKRLAVCGIEGKNLHDTRGTFATELCIAGFENSDVAEFMGWSGDSARVARIRARYVNRSRLIRARIATWNKGRNANG
jgi:integrase